jgi:uncharacterized protein YidB (DUF937 family)
MGLLDDLIGQLAGNASARSTEVLEPSAPRAGIPGSTGGMSKVMMALLPIVLGMMASGQRNKSPGPGQATNGGGLGDILGQVLGGARGSGGLGGLGELLEQFQRAGFGEQARSWVSTGENHPLPPDALERVFGRGGIAEIARRAGLSEQDATRGLSQLMPEVVDRMTPDGRLPDTASLLASVDSLTKRMGLA